MKPFCSLLSITAVCLFSISCSNTGYTAKSSKSSGSGTSSNRASSDRSFSSTEFRDQAKARGGDKDRHGMPTYGDRERVRTVRTTAYYHGEADHIQYGKKTASGRQLQYGKVRSAAADWSRYPLGTKFRIKGLPHIFEVDDYGSALVGTNTVDIYTRSRQEMNWWGVRYVQIEILEMGDFKRSYDILSTRMGFPHTRRMAEAIKQTRPSATYASREN